MCINRFFRVNFDEEYDESVHEVVRVHFDPCCPLCNVNHAGTSIYSYIYEFKKYNKSFYCQECRSEFRINNCYLDENYNDDFDALIEVIKNNNKL